MSHRNQYLLFAAMSAAGAGLLAWVGLVENAMVGNPGGAKILTALMFLGGAGAFYFFVHAFIEPPNRPPPTARYMPSPEVAFDFSAGEGAPLATATATTEALRTALAAGKGFTVADDPAGWLLLTGTIGPPRWVKGPTGEVTAEKQFARLTLRPGADPNALRPEDVSLVSTEMNLTVNASLALAAAFGSLRIRARGDTVWFVVGEGLFGLLAMRLVQTRPPVAPFRAGAPDL